MAVSITLYKVNKLYNSTKQPTSAELYKTVTGNFVEDSSFYSPTILLSRDEVVNVALFNYFSIAWPHDTEVRRYYWVTDKVITSDGRIRITSTEDCFATFRYNIYNSKNYIVRASKLFNSDIIDVQYQLESVVNSNSYKHLVSGGNIWAYGQGHMLYVLGIVAQEVTSPSDSGVETNNSNFSRGAVRYYVTTYTYAFALLSAFMSQTGVEADFDFSKFVVSCTAIPVNRSVFGISVGAINDLYFKLTNTPADTDDNHRSDLYVSVPMQIINGIPTSGVLENSFSAITLDDHPQKTTYGNMVNLAPYTTVQYVDGLLGTVDLDMSVFPSNQIEPYLEIDLVTGAANMIFGPAYVTSLSNKVGIDVNIVSISSNSYIANARNELGLFNNSFNVAKATLGSASAVPIQTAGNIVDATVSFVNAAADYALNRYENNIPSVSSRGSNGAMIGFNQPAMIIQRFTKIVSTDMADELFPRLVCDCKKLEDYDTALVICSNATLKNDTTKYSTNMTPYEISTICNQLNSGMYLE